VQDIIEMEQLGYCA